MVSRPVPRQRQQLHRVIPARPAAPDEATAGRFPGGGRQDTREFPRAQTEHGRFDKKERRG